MPKETVRSAGRPFVILEDGNEVPPDSPLVKPRKGGGGYPLLERGISVRWGRSGKDTDVEIGVHEFEASTGAIVSGHFSQFDRDGINSLIRLLRKARDQALGADA